jgi:cobalt-precorrin-5B (C1)-methyltransferase
MRKKRLRSGYITGACAAAAAKAAAMLLMSYEFGVQSLDKIQNVEIPFPDGSRVRFPVYNSQLKVHDSRVTAVASIIKDAGDDPDVTNGAEIVAEVKVRSEKLEMRNEHPVNTFFSNSHSPLPTSHLLIIKGGKGVGIVTKPGLPVPVGEAAIDPVPRKMIRDAILEAITTESTEETLPLDTCPLPILEIIISVTDGEILAKKTLNPRLGIMGGISILGTTGIVKPISSEAWTATITSSMDVAKAMGHDEIVLSAGRSSEKAHMKKFNLAEESYVMMGDYLEFALLEAKKHGFKKIHLCAQWAKMLKIAMATMRGGDFISPTNPLFLTDQKFSGYTTHVRHGAIDIKKAVEFLTYLGIQNPEFRTRNFNTAREIFDFINSELGTRNLELFKKVCNTAKGYAEGITKGVPVTAHLVSYEGEIIASSE